MILLWKLTTVSIHAPTWGATLDLHVSSLLAAVVSIHAPTWGATSRVCSQARRNRFQSTRPRGARHVDGFSDKRVLVSIHAPTWGATFLKSAMMLNAQFQSTRPRGARLSLLCTASFRFSFNPRAHVGRDIYTALLMSVTAGFQSTRPRGARLQSAVNLAVLLLGFTPRAHVGRDRVSSRKYIYCFHVFQSTRPRGARRISGQAASWCPCFNPRAHVGRDGYASRGRYLLQRFNPRAHVGRD